MHAQSKSYDISLHFSFPLWEIRIITIFSLKGGTENRYDAKEPGEKYLPKMPCNSKVRVILLIIIKILFPNINSNIQQK